VSLDPLVGVIEYLAEEVCFYAILAHSTSLRYLCMTPIGQVSERVSEQLLENCCRNSARAAIPLTLAIFLTYLLLHNKVNNQHLLVWALFCAVSILTRVVLLRVINQSPTLSQVQKRSYATFCTLWVGSSIAAVMLFFFQIELFERAMLTAILLGLCSPSHTTNFGYRPWLLAYIGPLLGSLAVMWMLNIDKQINSAYTFAIGVSILIVAHTLMRNGKFMLEVLVIAIESSIKLEEQSERLSEALLRTEHAKKEAETSSESKTRFIAAASHDLRQPVHVLNLFSGALKHSALDAKTRDIVDNMNVAVNSLSSQLNSLLDISELDSGSVKPCVKSVDLHRLVGTLMGGMKKLAEDKQIAFNNEIPTSIFVQSDPAMLSQIIRNLCGNAIKYTHEGSVTINASETDMRVELSITDTGIGIDSTESNKVFEEFYQASNPTRDKSQGLGLGLSIVERLVTSLGHSLTLDSTLNVGTTVSIAMQRCNIRQLSTPLTPLAADQTTIVLPDGFHVHVVDDDPTVQQSIRAFLEPLGAIVTASESSKAAIRFLYANKPSALLIDLHLSDEDSGLRVLDSIENRQPPLPTALITGQSLESSDIGERYPDLLMLQKPVSNDALLDLLDYMVVDAIENPPVAVHSSVPDKKSVSVTENESIDV